MQNRDISHFNMIDWDFKSEDSRSFVHNFCWYPSRFIPIIPAYLIRALSKEGDTILDPYCGSGTTILECLKLNRNAVGIDLNPIACFIAKVKVSVLKKSNVDVATLQRISSKIGDLSASVADVTNSLLFSTVANDIEIPNRQENEGWYHPDTLKMLSQIHHIVSQLQPGATKDLCLLFFYSILIPSSGHENKRPYTYFADNVKPKVKIFNNAYKLFLNKLQKFIKEYNAYTMPACTDADIINSDVIHLREQMAARAPVDLIVTSPPYLSVTDYTTAYRLVYLWGDFQTDINIIKQQEIGARWKRKKQTRMDDYLNSIHRSISDMAHVLKRGGYIALILGEPKGHSEEIGLAIQNYAVQNAGLSLVEAFSRNVSKNYFLHPVGGVPSEDIMIFQKVV